MRTLEQFVLDLFQPIEVLPEGVEKRVYLTIPGSSSGYGRQVLDYDSDGKIVAINWEDQMTHSYKIGKNITLIYDRSA